MGWGREWAGWEFALHEVGDVAERAEGGEFVVTDGDLEDVLGEDDDLPHGQRIEAEVFDEAKVVGGGGEFSAEIAIDVAFDDADENGEQVFGIAGAAETVGGVEGGGGAALQ